MVPGVVHRPHPGVAVRDLPEHDALAGQVHEAGQEAHVPGEVVGVPPATPRSLYMYCLKAASRSLNSAKTRSKLAPSDV